LWLCTGGVLYFFSLLAEIDLFFCLIILGGIFAVYHFGEQKKYWAAYLLVYLSCGLGVLTKGLPPFIFTATTLLVYFLDRRQFKLLFHPAHFAGIGLLALILGGYYYQYDQYNDVRLALHRMFTESTVRTATNYTALDTVKHLFLFPFKWLGDMAPSSLLLVFLIRKDWRALLFKQHPFVRFCLLALLFNAIPYWLSPGTHFRYLYMMNPLIAIILGWSYIQRHSGPAWQGRVWSGLGWFIGTAACLAALALPWVKELQFLPHLTWIAAAGFVVFGLMFWLRKRYPSQQLALFFGTFALIRIAFSLTVLPERDYRGGTREPRDLAHKIFKVCGKAPLRTAHEEFPVPYGTAYYLNRWRGDILQRQDYLQAGVYYILPESKAPQNRPALLHFEYDGVKKVLVKY
jgi:4-amino-4-deoxy-L-arabinose transferase-like glycosyltransferase